MPITAQLSPRLAIGGFDWTGNTSAIDFGVESAPQDATTFATAPFTNSVPGMRTMTVPATAFNDHTTVGGLDTWLAANHGTVEIVTLAYLADAVGNAAAVAPNGFLGGSNRHFNASVGAISTTVSTVSGGVMGEGLITQSGSSTVTATGNSTTQQVGALTAGRTIWATIHVLSVTGTTPSLTCQLASAATSGGSYTLRGSASSAFTATGAQALSVTTATTDSWWRLAFTVSGTTPVFGVFAAIALI